MKPLDRWIASRLEDLIVFVICFWVVGWILRLAALLIGGGNA